MALGLGEYITVSQLHRRLIRGRRGVLYHNFIDRQLGGRNVYSCTVKLFIKEPVTFEFRGLKGGDRRVRIFSAHNNWWATPEVSSPLPYQRSAKVFLNLLRQGVKATYYFKMCIRSS